MGRRPPLSKAEMEVARVLWDLGSATVRQVHEALSRDREIDFNTVQTYLVRLEAKGYLRSRLRERTKIFTARVRPEKVIRETVDDFVSRLFGGEAVPLMRQMRAAATERMSYRTDHQDEHGQLPKLRPNQTRNRTRSLTVDQV